MIQKMKKIHLKKVMRNRQAERRMTKGRIIGKLEIIGVLQSLHTPTNSFLTFDNIMKKMERSYQAKRG